MSELVKKEAHRIMDRFNKTREPLPIDDLKVCSLICIDEIMDNVLPFDSNTKQFYKKVREYIEAYL